MKAAWHGDSGNSVVKDALEEPGPTPLYVGLQSAWGSQYGDRMFYPHFLRDLLNWGL